MLLIDKKRFADDYCKKMCAGGCSEQARSVCEFMKLLDAQPIAFEVKDVFMLEKAIEIMEGGGIDDTHPR